MEAVSKDKTEVKEELKEMFSGNELYELQSSVQMHLQTSPNIKGRHLRIMYDNLAVLDRVLLPIVTEHSKVIAKYATLDEKNAPVRENDQYQFDSEEKKAKYEEESKVIWEDTKRSVELMKFPLFIFDEMEFNTTQNNKVFLIMKYLVNEQE